MIKTPKAFNISKKEQGRTRPALLVFIPSLAFLSLLLCSFHSFAQKAETETSEYRFTYEVYAGGIHAVESDLTLSTQKDHYDIQLLTRTRGWLGALVPWEGAFHSTGTIRDDSFISRQHQSIATWRGETETKTFTYQDNELISLEIDEDGKEKQTPEINPELTKATTDILSATFTLMSALKETNLCEGRDDIYDGERRFTLIFRDQGAGSLPESRYNAYTGPARVCTVEIEPKGGRWHKKPRGWLSIQEQGRKKGSLPTVWMAQMPGIPFAVPVKIRVKTNYGTLLMHLKSAR